MRIYKNNLQILIILQFWLFPALIFAGENVWTSNGPSGGSVWTYAFHPLDHNIIYCGTVQNGIYKSINNGQNWEHMPLSNLYESIRVIQIHPTAPDTMYAGTAHGMFKSTDAGMTWNLLYPPDQVTNDYMAFIMHPIYPNILFGGMIGGFKSTDSGDTWRRLDLPPFTDMVRFIINPVNPNIIYFVGGNMPNGNGIFKSTDLGETWSPIQNNLDSTGFGNDLAIDSDDPNILYFARSNSQHEGETCLSKSTNGGQSWVDISPHGLSMPAIKRVRISPSDHQKIYIATYYDGVWVSTDAGDSWQAKNQGLKVLEVAAMEFNPMNGTIYLGTYNGGAYRSTDDGEHWEPISENINCSSCNNFAVSPFDSMSIFAAMDNGLFHSANAGESWESVDMGLPINPVVAVIADKYREANIYACGFCDNRPDLPSGFWRSTDNGGSWQLLNNGLPSYIGYQDMAISYADSMDRRVFLATWHGLYISDDLGQNWTVCQGNLPQDYFYGRVTVAPDNQNMIAVGIDSAQILYSTDRGDNWERAAPLPVQSDRFIYDIQFDPWDDNIIYVSCLMAGFFKSNNMGQSWESIVGDLPIIPPYPYIPEIAGICINPVFPDNIFVHSNGLGIYQTHNSGINWEAFNTGLDTANVFGLKISFFPGDTTRLMAASSSRGIWSIHRTLDGISDDSPAIPNKLSISSYPNPFNAQTTISYSLSHSGPVTLSIYNLLGQLITTIFDGPQSAGAHNVVWDASAFPSGLYFARLKAGDHFQSTKLILLK